jgi:ATP-dependent helicase/nuclease subunit A
VPTLTIATVKEWTADATRELPPAARDLVVLVDDSLPRDPSAQFHGAVFGILVHAVLAQVPFDARGEAVKEFARAEARLLSVDETSAAAAAARAEQVLQHGLLARARAAESRGACRREVPVTLRLADGALVEGVVDLAFEEDGRWVVVDYKTDYEIADAGQEGYRRQIAVYSAAIACATGAPASGVLLRI